uniref:Large ribosomal subunit protein mL42 n=1 Tax=Cacopsylla melanoneura TaxID=428564 RepID=A0A8D8TSN2_9HEMI
MASLLRRIIPLTHKIAVTPDGTTVVCWHPEPPFPYEHSLPLPVTEQSTNSVLKVQNVDEVYEIFKPKKPEFVRQDLMNITFTNKHRWFPLKKKYQKKRFFKPLVPDREYL